MIESFLGWCSRHRAPATLRFYHARLRAFRSTFGTRDAASVTSLEIDAYLHDAGLNVSDSTRHHNAVSLTTLQSFALRESLIEKPWFKRLEKPRMGRRERIPSADEIGGGPGNPLISTGCLRWRRKGRLSARRLPAPLLVESPA
jgi:hypothetical protein